MLVKDSPQVTPDHSTLTSKIWMEEIQDMDIVVGRGGHARGGGQGYDGLPNVGELYCTYKFTNATS